LHHALLQALESVLVMTSCNISGQPQLYEDAAVLETFAGALDGVVGHNRSIVRRLEDSVVRICPLTGKRAQVVRLARGLAPFHQTVVGKQETTPISATGADLKAAIALKRDRDIVLSQYLGDLSNPLNHASYEQAWQDLHTLYQHQPAYVVADSHPGYFSHAFAHKQNLEVKTVQHHCAHLKAVLVEKNADPHQAYLGVILDGLGYGDDGGLWGGELLHWQNGCCKRLTHAEPFRLLGCEKAQKTPWRILLSLLWQYKGRSWEQERRLQSQLASLPLDLLYQAWEKGINAPYTTSVARWFDALAALTGLWWDEMSYEGQAAQLTEALFDPESDFKAPFKISSAGQLSMEPFLEWWLKDPDRPERVVVTAFYKGLAEAIVSWIKRHRKGGEIGVVLSGGVAQNLTLIALIESSWPADLPPLLVAEKVPANDQGIPLGQFHSSGK
jgi:hydrogenase maturation protein HypF